MIFLANNPQPHNVPGDLAEGFASGLDLSLTPLWGLADDADRWHRHPYVHGKSMSQANLNPWTGQLHAQPGAACAG